MRFTWIACALSAAACSGDDRTDRYTEAHADKPPNAAGVGGLAAALATAPEFTDVTTVCVEPDRAACLLKSAKSGMRAVVEGELNTIMAGLACGEPSIVAWDKLRHQGASFLSIPEHAAIAAKAVLEHSAPPAVALSAGESGVAGLAGLICASIDTALRKSLALSPLSQVILIGTESSTTLRGRS